MKQMINHFKAIKSFCPVSLVYYQKANIVKNDDWAITDGKKLVKVIY